MPKSFQWITLLLIESIYFASIRVKGPHTLVWIIPSKSTGPLGCMSKIQIHWTSGKHVQISNPLDLWDACPNLNPLDLCEACPKFNPLDLWEARPNSNPSNLWEARLNLWMRLILSETRYPRLQFEHKNKTIPIRVESNMIIQSWFYRLLQQIRENRILTCSSLPPIFTFNAPDFPQT